MRPSVLVFFLLLSLLVSAAQAIRFKNEQLFSFHHHEIHEAAETSSSSLIKTSGGSDPVGDKVTVLCKEGNCITGSNRKLLITPTTSTPSTTIPKNEKNINGDDANPRSPMGKSSDYQHEETTDSSSKPTSSSSSDEHQDVDITDITEMDYSPAKKKPPIHN